MDDLHAPGVFDVPADALAHAMPAPKDSIAVDRRSKYYFGDVTLVGACDLEPEDFDLTRPAPYGLRPMYLGWYGYLRGESGAHYYPQRMLEGQMSPRLDLTRSTGWEPATDVRDAAQSFQGFVHAGVNGDRWAVTSLGSPKRPRLAYSVQPAKGGTWDEEGLLHLELEAVGPATQTYHPDPAMDFYWRQLVFVARGRILDDPVVGLAGLETAWGNGSLNWMDLPMYHRVEDQWVFDVTEYRDGGREVTSMFTSLDGRLGAGMHLVDGEPRPVYWPRSEFDQRDDGMTARVRWDFLGAPRETVLETGTMQSPRTPGDHAWQCGHSRPLDSDREVSWSFSFVETVRRSRGEHQ